MNDEPDIAGMAAMIEAEVALSHLLTDRFIPRDKRVGYARALKVHLDALNTDRNRLIDALCSAKERA